MPNPFTIRLDGKPTNVVVSITGDTSTRRSRDALIDRARAAAAHRFGKPAGEVWVSEHNHNETAMMVAFQHVPGRADQ